MRVLWLGALDSWCLSLNRPKIVGEMGSFESSEMEIGAYKRSCAQAVLEVPRVCLFDTSYLEQG